MQTHHRANGNEENIASIYTGDSNQEVAREIPRAHLKSPANYRMRGEREKGVKGRQKGS